MVYTKRLSNAQILENIQFDPFYILNLSFNRITYEMCEAAVGGNGRLIGSIPEELITEELCLMAVSQNGLALENVPEDYISYEVCRIAVFNDSDALDYVPDDYRDSIIAEL